MARQPVGANSGSPPDTYRALVDHSPEAAYVVQDGRIVYVNPAAVRLFGAASEESLLGTDILDRVHPDCHALALRRRKQVLETGEPAPLTEMTFLALDGRIFEVEVQATPIEFNGRLGTYAAARDISNRKRLEAQVQESQKLEAVGRLAGGVAHDFNNTLAVILGHAEFVLAALRDDDPLREDLQAIQRAAQHSAALTRQLLTYARRQPVVPRALDLNAAVTETLKMLRPLIGESITLDWQPGEDIWPISLDPSQLDQILTNLCANARDAISDVGRISIHAENRKLSADAARALPEAEPGEYVLLRVADTGRGMTADVVARAFEPFFTTKGIGQGTGLGLSTVYGILRQNGGSVSLRSAPAEGTTVDLYFPRRVIRATEEEAAESPAAARATPGVETVLLVEDEPHILRLADRALRAKGYHVLSAGSPEAALALSREHDGEIHLLLTDVMMPQMSGPDLARALAASRRALKVVFMSGFSADLIAAQGKLDAETAFLGKPFTLDELGRKLREVLDGG